MCLYTFIDYYSFLKLSMEKIFFIILRSIKWDETFNFILFF